MNGVVSFFDPYTAGIHIIQPRFPPYRRVELYTKIHPKRKKKKHINTNKDRMWKKEAAQCRQSGDSFNPRRNVLKIHTLNAYYPKP